MFLSSGVFYLIAIAAQVVMFAEVDFGLMC